MIGFRKKCSQTCACNGALKDIFNLYLFCIPEIFMTKVQSLFLSKKSQRLSCSPKLT